MKIDVVFSEFAWQQYEEYKKSGNKKAVKKINDLLEDIERNIIENKEKFEKEEPFDEKGLGNPEALKYDYSGYWSRRIDKKNRLVYRLQNKKIEVTECKYHYVSNKKK